MFNYNECGVCLDIKYLSKTNCNHHFCIRCITKVTKCPFCRKDFILPKLFTDLKKYFLEKENKKLLEIKNIFDVLPNYVEPIQNITLINNNIQYTTNLFVDCIFLDSQERMRFQQNTHEYLINQVDFVDITANYNYIPLEQTNLNLI